MRMLIGRKFFFNQLKPLTPKTAYHYNYCVKKGENNN